MFDAIVTPAVLYASATWALTRIMEHQLRVNRNRMLRDVFRIFRTKANGEDEDWITYIRRATRKIEKIAKALSGSKLVVLPDVKHSIMLECGDVVAGHMLSFIQREHRALNA